jgi:hypothetical protein
LICLWDVLGLIDPTLVVGDLGCGTGQLTNTIAPYVRASSRSTPRPTCSTQPGGASPMRLTSSSGKVSSNRCRYVERDSFGKEQVLKPLLLIERGLHPQVRRARQNAFCVVDRLRGEERLVQLVHLLLDCTLPPLLFRRPVVRLGPALLPHVSDSRIHVRVPNVQLRQSAIVR